jgi:hypothetical protein
VETVGRHEFFREPLTFIEGFRLFVESVLSGDHEVPKQKKVQKKKKK